MINEPVFLVVDLFCGAGGTTCGFVQAELEGTGIAKVIACVNHDAKAIKSHWLNHPEVKHFEEDIRTLDLTELVKLVGYYRNKYPNALLILWASLECTNFSKAKGGQPRDADSRTLADHLDRYVVALNPDYIQIENVVEFMSWGPLDEKGKPVSRKNGQDWLRWRNLICSHGYRDEWRELNSANYGAYTSRNRLFGVFAKTWLPIAFPEPTHAKNPSKHSIHGDLKKWMPVKDVLDFSDEGKSIFTRSKPLSDKTLERIYAGLIKYVAKGDTAFISKYFSGRPKGKVNSVNDPSATVTTFGGSTLVQAKSFSDLSIEQPAGTVTTKDHHALVQTESFIINHCQSGYVRDVNQPAPTLLAAGQKSPVHLVQPAFFVQRNSGDPERKIFDVEGPARTITTTGGNQELVQPKFLTLNYSQGNQLSSVNLPSPTLTTKDRVSIVSAEFLNIHNGKSKTRSVDEPSPTIACNDRLSLVQPEYLKDNGQHQSINAPAGTLMPNDKHRLVQCDAFIMPTHYDNKPRSIDEPAPTITANRKHHYIVNPSHGGHSTSTEAPCPVIVARQDKAPLYLVQVENGPIAIAVYDGEGEAMIKIKQFMAAYSLVDIKMRMLRVGELLRIQGFPSVYRLEGNQADQKKFIGNSVVPHVVKCWTESLAIKIIGNRKAQVA